MGGAFAVVHAAPPPREDFICTSYPDYSRALATLLKQNVKCLEEGGGVESELGIKSVKNKEMWVDNGFEIIKNLKQHFSRKKKSENQMLVSLAICSIANCSFWDKVEHFIPND